MRQRQAFNTLALWLLTVLLTVSCQPHHKKPQLTTQQLAYNDSLIYAAMDRDYNEALLVIDSLEDVHALYDAKVSFYRAQVYFKMGQDSVPNSTIRKLWQTMRSARRAPTLSSSPMTNCRPFSPSRATSRDRWPLPQKAMPKRRKTIQRWDSTGSPFCCTTSATARCS